MSRVTESIIDSLLSDYLEECAEGSALMLRRRSRIAEGGGQASGKLEVDSTDVDKALAWARAEFSKHGRDLDKEIPRFAENYKKAQSLSRIGKTQRKDMPVILDGSQVKHFQQRLKSGYIDLNKPFASDAYKKDPFPQGLRGEDAKQWLSAGLHDGSKSDDKVSVSMTSTPASKLKPIQRQIYVDKALGGTAKFGVDKSVAFLKKSLTIKSDDNYIIDGHHRWLQALLIDPSIPLKGVSVNLSIYDLLPLSLAYGDALGNKRNR